MSSDLEEKLSVIHDQLKKIGISLSETKKLFQEAQQILSQGGKKTKAVEFEEINICLATMDIVFKFVEDWQNGKVSPLTDQELDFLEKMSERMPELIDALAKKNLLINRGDNFFIEANQNRKKLKKLIQQEKTDRTEQNQPNKINRRQVDSQQTRKEFN